MARGLPKFDNENRDQRIEHEVILRWVLKHCRNIIHKEIKPLGRP